MVSLDVPASDLARVREIALRHTAALADGFRESIGTWPALAEPVVVLAVAKIEAGRPLDASDTPWPISRAEDPGAALALDRVLGSDEVSWIAGRLVDEEGALRLVPLSAFGARLTRLR